MADILDMVDGEEYYNADELDEKALLGEEDDIVNNRNIKREEVEDLYDAAIEPSGVVIEKRDSSENNEKKSTPTISAHTTTGKRYCCYVGNMTWWTTDNLIKSCNVNDLIDIKFYENRNNGQSKGFALAVFASELSVKTIMEKLSTKKLHDQLLLVLPYNKQSLAKFEEATKQEKQQPGMINIGTVRIGHHSQLQQQSQQINTNLNLGLHLGNNNIPRTNLAQSQQLQAAAAVQIQQQQQATQIVQHQQPTSINPLLNFTASNGQSLSHQLQIRPSGLPSLMSNMNSSISQTQPPGLNMSGPLPNMTGPPPSSLMSRPPPGFQHQAQTNTAPQSLRTNIPPPGIAIGQPGFPPGAHINPQVYPSFAQNYGHIENNASIGVSEAEFEEIMNRNHTVSSSAISRAVRDAAAGDFNSAIETLVTAISLIRQSRVANDARCKVLDTLQDMEAKSYNYSSRKHRSTRDRGSRSPSASRTRKRHRRSSRSRSRSRDRYGYDSPPRHSNRGRY